MVDPDAGKAVSGRDVIEEVLNSGVGSVNTEKVNTIPQGREKTTGGSGTEADPFVLPADLLSDYHSTVELGRGWFEVDGLTVDSAYAFDEESNYIEGVGIRSTTLHHAAGTPTTPTVHINASSGNFGGLRDMTVYGAGRLEQGTGSADIVRVDGGIIDTLHENVIYRYGGRDALHLIGSGHRVTNSWLENCSRHGLSLDGGNRQKVDNVHIIGNDEQQVHVECDHANFSNLTLGGGKIGIATRSDSNNNGGKGNEFENVICRGHANQAIYTASAHPNTFRGIAHAKDVGGTDGSLSGTGIKAASGGDVFGLDRWVGFDSQAARLDSPNNIIEGGVVSYWGKGSINFPAFDINDNDNHIRDVTLSAGYNSRNVIANIDGSRNVLDIDVRGGFSWEINVGSGSDNIISCDSLNWTNISDSGTRTVLNGVGLNSGDPNTTGQWNGNGREGLKVRDTTNANTYLYNNGSWSQIASA